MDEFQLEKQQRIIDGIKKRTTLDDETINKVIEALKEYIIEKLKLERQIIMPLFGKFSLRIRHERSGRDILTGERVTLPETKAVEFRASKTLKEKFN